MFTFLIVGVVVIGMLILKDWLVYKHRGRARPDDPNDENPPVVTGPEDALAQRLIDLSKKDQE